MRSMEHMKPRMVKGGIEFSMTTRRKKRIRVNKSTLYDGADNGGAETSFGKAPRRKKRG